MNKKFLKCAVVDDSTIQRLAVVNLIKKHPRLKLVGQWNNAIEAINGLLDTQIDILFLDIEMPILNGFNLLDDLENIPHIVVVTGKSKYAQKAFDYCAIDFLKKPIKPNRFSLAIEKIVQAEIGKTTVVDENNAPSIFIKSGVKKHKIFLKDILYISALGDFAKIHLAERSVLLVSGTMTYLESLLPNTNFFRVHRSFIVNLHKIERFTSRYLEIENETIPISRKKTQSLKTVLNFR